VSGVPWNEEPVILPALILGDTLKYDAVVAYDADVIEPNTELATAANDEVVAYDELNDAEAQLAEVAAVAVVAVVAEVAVVAATALADHDAVPNKEPVAANANIFAPSTYSVLSNDAIIFNLVQLATLPFREVADCYYCLL
jgi:hypothetical protein